MTFLKRVSRFRITSFSLLLLCILLAVVTSQKSSSSGVVKKKPSVVLEASTSSIILPCEPGTHSSSSSCPAIANTTVGLVAIAKGFHRQAIYDYTVDGGLVRGDGSNISWDLSGIGPGTYTATVRVTDDKKHIAISKTNVTITKCSDCVPELLCPTISLSCGDDVRSGTQATFNVSVVGNGHIKRSYNWSISNGTIISGQGTSSITVNTTGIREAGITATVELGGGFAPECQRTASCTITVHR